VSPKAKKKSKVEKTTEKKPAVYYSDKPVSLKEWRTGKNSPKQKPVRQGG
jgi:hypothetical protein